MMENEQEVSVEILKELATSNLNRDTQDEVISKLLIHSKKGDYDSMFDKIFGNRNPQIYVTLLMSIIVLIILAMFTVSFKENIEFVKDIWNIAMPTVTLLWGYAFGKSHNKQ